MHYNTMRMMYIRGLIDRFILWIQPSEIGDEFRLIDIWLTVEDQRRANRFDLGRLWRSDDQWRFFGCCDIWNRKKNTLRVMYLSFIRIKWDSIESGYSLIITGTQGREKEIKRDFKSTGKARYLDILLRHVFSCIHIYLYKVSWPFLTASH